MPNGKPNILVIWGDDIGITNLSCYSDGLMGYRTPNIDRIANEGMRFTDSYGQQSCTAGRAAFITGQNPYRTGLTKVGMPGADIGLQAEDATIAELLKPLGYATGQFGKNHFGDRNKYLPTVHGFDEFYGNLYHLNADEEPEHVDYPSDAEFPNFKKIFGPRGVIHSWATEEDDPTEQPALGPRRQAAHRGHRPADQEAHGDLRHRVPGAAQDFIKRAHADDKPFFVWFNTTWMHFRVHPPEHVLGQAGRWQSFYHDVMVEHDKHVGQMLDLLDELGIAEDTIVMYSTDNGPHMNTWPDGAMTPFRNEKNSNWEGAFRVPEMVRWPGKIPAGVVSNEIISHTDWLPTLLAAAGDAEISEKLKKGCKVGDKTLQGAYRRLQLPALLHRPGGERARARVSSTSLTTATWWGCATITGSSSSPSSASRVRSKSGRSRSSSCACPRSSTCAPTPSSGRTSLPTPTMIG